MKQFIHHFMPDYVVPGVGDVDFEELAKLGVKHLAFGVDNTLVAQERLVLPTGTVDLLRGLVRMGMFESLALASNSTRDLSFMGTSVNATLFQANGTHRKPMAPFYRKIVDSFGCASEKVAMFDDKLMHIMGAKHVGMVCVLVDPLGNEKWLDAMVFRRKIEQKLLRYMA